MQEVCSYFYFLPNLESCRFTKAEYDGLEIHTYLSGGKVVWKRISGNMKIRERWIVMARDIELAY